MAEKSVAFVLGLIVGAVAALFFAPKSGEELRAELSREAQLERRRLQKEYTEAVGDVHQRLDKMQADVQETLDHLKKQAGEATADAA